MLGELDTAIAVLMKARELATEEEIAKVDELLTGLQSVIKSQS